MYKVTMSDNNKISSHSDISSQAKLGNNIEIGPFCQIGPHVTLGDNVKIHSHVVVCGQTSIGNDCEIYPFASLGKIPQVANFVDPDHNSKLIIGANNRIREHVTMHSGTEHGGWISQVGDNGLYMAGSHIAHDCILGDDIIFANNATLGGHCTIGDGAILGGLTAVHQFVRIGRKAFIGGMSGIEHDVIPFGLAIGHRAGLGGLNIVGLKRSGFTREDIHELRAAYQQIFASGGTLQERVDKVAQDYSDNASVVEIVEFIRNESSRALCVPRETKEH